MKIPPFLRKSSDIVSSVVKKTDTGIDSSKIKKGAKISTGLSADTFEKSQNRTEEHLQLVREQTEKLAGLTQGKHTITREVYNESCADIPRTMRGFEAVKAQEEKRRAIMRNAQQEGLKPSLSGSEKSEEDIVQELKNLEIKTVGNFGQDDVEDLAQISEGALDLSMSMNEVLESLKKL